MNKRKGFRVFVNLLFIFFSITVFLGLNTSYVPNLMSIVLGFFVALIAFGILLLEMHLFKDKSVTGFVEGWRFSKIVMLVLFFLGFVWMGVYGVSYPVHSLVAREVVEFRYARPISPTSARMFRCDTRVRISVYETPWDSETYCASRSEFDLVVNGLPIKRNSPFRQVKVVYEESFIGKKIISIDEI